MPKVYLAGPISGMTYEAAQKWRDLVAGLLYPDVQCFSPLRQKDFLKSVGPLEGSYAVSPLSTDRGIMTRDHWDVRTSDLVFFNLLDTDRVSIGTVMELAWCYAYRIPTVVAIQKSNVHDHPMTREAIDYRVETLTDAVLKIKAILLPEVASRRPMLKPVATEATFGYGGTFVPATGRG